MITRLFALLLYICHTRAQNNKDCSFRVDILDGSNLPEGLAIFLKEKTTTQSPEECALDCYRNTCDVAYFHHSSFVCQFTANSSSTESSLSCHDVFSEQHLEGIKEIDTVLRYCIHCRDSESTGKKTVLSKETLSQEIVETIPNQIWPLNRERTQNRTSSWDSWNKHQSIYKGPMVLLRLQGHVPSQPSQLIRSNMRMPTSTQPRMYTTGWARSQLVHQISSEKVQLKSVDKTPNQKKQYRKFFHNALYPSVIIPQHIKRKGFGIAK